MFHGHNLGIPVAMFQFQFTSKSAPLQVEGYCRTAGLKEVSAEAVYHFVTCSPQRPGSPTRKNNTSKQYDILITRGSMKTLAILYTVILTLSFHDLGV